jgi:hypothetical protein
MVVMEHLSFEAVCRIADGDTDENLLSYRKHLEICPKCRHEVDLQRSIRSAARQIPLPDVSPVFNTIIMSRILPVKKWGIREHVSHAAGYIVAGSWVLIFLGILLYALQSEGSSSSETVNSQNMGKFLKIFSDANHQIVHTFLQTISSKSPDASVLKFGAIILLAIIILAFIDKMMRSFFHYVPYDRN